MFRPRNIQILYRYEIYSKNVAFYVYDICFKVISRYKIILTMSREGCVIGNLSQRQSM